MDKTGETSRHGKRKIALAICFLLVLAGGAIAYWYMNIRGIVYSDDARLDGGLLDIAPMISGSLLEVAVSEGDRIRQGQVLFSLDKEPLQAAVNKAAAAVDSAKAAVSVAEAQYQKALSGPRAEEIKVAESVKLKTEAQVKLAQADWDRIRRLYEGQVSSQAARDQAHTNLEIARQAYNQAESQLKLLKEGTRSEDLAAAKANLDLQRSQLASARAALAQAEINLGYAQVPAPFDGQVVRKWQGPGAILSAGRPVLTILNPADLQVSANIEEKYLSQITMGDKVDISVDAYPNLNLTGKVDKILQATNSKFSLIPSEGSSGTFIKVAQRVPIRIALNSLPDPDLPIGPGLSVEVRIHVSRDKSGRALASHNE